MITVGADGKMFTLKEKNQDILNQLKETLEMQKEKKITNMNMKKPLALKFGAIINNKLLQIFRCYGLMTENELASMTAVDLQEYYIGFLELINTISNDIEITPTKPLFCAYMGITTKIFNKFTKNEDPEIRNWVDAINGDFTHSLFDSSLQGNASEKTALAFASTKDYGQEIVQNDFSATIINKQEVEYTPRQALEYAESIKKMIEEAASAKKNKRN